MNCIVRKGLDTYQDDYEAQYARTHEELRMSVAMDRRLRIDAAVREGYRRNYVSRLRLRSEVYQRMYRDYMSLDLAMGAPTSNTLKAIYDAYNEFSRAPTK